MKKLVLFLTFISILAGCCINSAHHATLTDGHDLLVQGALDKTVALVMWVDKEGKEVEEPGTDDTMRPYCSGVWVSSDVILTAGHCVAELGMPPMDEEERLMKKLFNIKIDWDPTGQPLQYATTNDVKDLHGLTVRNQHRAIVLAFDGLHDLALLKAEPASGAFIPEHATVVVASKVKVGERVDIVGHPNGLWWSYISGYVSAIRIDTKNADGDLVDAIQISAPIWFGNSGGGAFNDSGELIGVCSWIRRNQPNTSFFIHRDHVNALMLKARVN